MANPTADGKRRPGGTRGTVPNGSRKRSHQSDNINGNDSCAEGVPDGDLSDSSLSVDDRCGDADQHLNLSLIHI